MPKSALRSAEGALKPEFEVCEVKANLPALDVLDLVDAGARIGDDLHLIAEAAVVARHHGEGHEAGAVHRQRVRAGVEAGDVQAPGAHRLDLGGVRLDREELHPLAGDLLHVIQEAGPGLLVDGRVLDRGVGEDQGRGIDLLAGIAGNVGDQVAVRVREALIQLELGVRRGDERPEAEREYGRSEECPTKHALPPCGCVACCSGAVARGPARMATATRAAPIYCVRSMLRPCVTTGRPSLDRR